MKAKILAGLAALTVVTCRADIYLEQFNSLNQVIADGNLVGTTYYATINDMASGNTVGGLTVGLNISGGFNGDLYAYLVAPNGSMVNLLNRPGVTGGDPFGYSGSGLNVTFSDSASGSIQTTPETSGNLVGGTYRPAASLSGFNGSSGNGTWTLFVADESAGGGSAKLNNFSMTITAVPEPMNIALGIFGVVVASIGGVRCCLRARKSTASEKQP